MRRSQGPDVILHSLLGDGAKSKRGKTEEMVGNQTQGRSDRSDGAIVINQPQGSLPLAVLCTGFLNLTILVFGARSPCHVTALC